MHCVPRRRFYPLLVGWILLAVAPSCYVRAEQIANENSVKIIWMVPQKAVKEIKSELQFSGNIYPDPSAPTDTKGLASDYIFDGTAVITRLANAIVSLCRNIAYGGVVIDTTGTEIRIQSDIRLDGGLLIVKSSDGTKIFHTDNMVSSSDLEKILSKQ